MIDGGSWHIATITNQPPGSGARVARGGAGIDVAADTMEAVVSAEIPSGSKPVQRASAVQLPPRLWCAAPRGQLWVRGHRAVEGPLVHVDAPARWLGERSSPSECSQEFASVEESLSSKAFLIECVDAFALIRHNPHFKYGSKAGYMARTLARLTALAVSRAKHHGYRADGGGLYLQISASGSKSWVFRFREGSRLREMGLGPAHR